MYINLNATSTLWHHRVLRINPYAHLPMQLLVRLNALIHTYPTYSFVANYVLCAQASMLQCSVNQAMLPNWRIHQQNTRLVAICQTLLWFTFAPISDVHQKLSLQKSLKNTWADFPILQFTHLHQGAKSCFCLVVQIHSDHPGGPRCLDTAQKQLGSDGFSSHQLAILSCVFQTSRLRWQQQQQQQ